VDNPGKTKQQSKTKSLDNLDMKQTSG